MSKQLPEPPVIRRDGTSQAGRIQPALDPGYVSVDERSIKDLLGFARDFSGKLKFFDAKNREAGDWSAFFGEKPDLDEIAAFMDDPSKIPPEKASFYSRPHFALFLTFLKLLNYPRRQINDLTRRHLDFYYLELLGMRKKAAIPDRVHVLLKPAEDADSALVPSGTLLSAGRDNKGIELFYRTERDIVVNHALVERLASLYVHKRITGILEAWERNRLDKEKALFSMLSIALGDPAPGDSPPRFAEKQNAEAYYKDLLKLAELLNFCRTRLYLEFFDLRSLIKLKFGRDHSDQEWKKINGFLEIAGRNRPGNQQFKITPAESRSFEANLEAAIGTSPSFDGLPEVKSLNDLYDHRLREDVQNFILKKLYFENRDDFVSMMQIKVRIDNEWGEINRILEQAGRKKKGNPDYHLTPSDPTNFEVNLKDSIDPDFSPLSPISNIDSYYEAVSSLEKDFHMAAENLSYLLSVAQNPGSTDEEWRKGFDILADAYKEKIYEGRRLQLKSIREKTGLDSMLSFALGEDPQKAKPQPLERLKRFVKSDTDYAFLKAVCDKTDASGISGEDWDRVYHIVDAAQRNRESLPEPVARKEEWLNIYPNENAPSVRTSLGGTVELDCWKTFGQKLPEALKVGSSPPPVLGWAVGSPLLSLSGGKRTITLTLGFLPGGFDRAKIDPLFKTGAKDAPFQIEMSSAKGWIVREPGSFNARSENYSSLTGIKREGEKLDEQPALQFVFTLDSDIDPIEPPAKGAAGIESPWPVLRLMLRQIPADENGLSSFITQHSLFKNLILTHTHIKVEASDLSPSIILNNEAVLDAKKPFEPFGASPSAGSRLWLAHPELVFKKLENLTFKLQWMNLPGNFEAYYKNYEIIWPDPGNKNFTACISLVDKGVELPIKAGAPLFSSLADPKALQAIEISDLSAQILKTRPGYAYERILDSPGKEDLLSWSRYIQWELNGPDFQHKTYPAAAAKKSLDMAAAIANRKPEETINPNDFLVNPPYTPTLKSLSLGYASSLEIIMDEYVEGSKAADRIFHIHPFGYAEIRPDSTGEGYPLRCRESSVSCHPFLPRYENEGELYIGISNVKAPQNVSLLFQMAEGSADPDLKPSSIQWACLSDNRWLDLHHGNIVSDSTRGFINTGIVELRLDPVLPSTLLPQDLYWLRAAIAEKSNGVCDTISVLAQAVSATFMDKSNASDHYGRPLPKESIKGPAEPIAEIDAIIQPYTSFGGKAAEGDSTFYTRVSERLRHKQRALSSWDYERLVLEKYPQIYKAKCIPAGSVKNPEDLGRVEIIVIPDVREMVPFRPFEPKASADLISDIELYLSGRCPAYATVKVRNARFISVRVRIGIRFKPGADEGYYKKQLNEDLNRFLTPWAFEDGADISIGGKIYANSIIDYIDRRNYVDCVAAIELFSSEDGINFKPVPKQSNDSEGYYVSAQGPDCVLVAARQHDFDIIPETGYEPAFFTGINYMKIELDFIVA